MESEHSSPYLQYMQKTSSIPVRRSRTQINRAYAQRTELGWGIIGNVSKHSSDGDEDNSVIAH